MRFVVEAVKLSVAAAASNRDWSTGTRATMSAKVENTKQLPEHVPHKLTRSTEY